MSNVGQPLPHESARGHVTGEALYTNDLLRRFPGVLHGWPVMSPYAHATVTAIDVSPALTIPGVVTTLTEAPGEADSGPNRHDEPLFPTEVLFHGQPVAWVLAETLEAARLGAAAVKVTYNQLPALVTLDDAIAAESLHSPPFQMNRADADTALAASPHKLAGELRIGGQEHFYLETQCALAWLDESGGVSLHSSTQHPSETQEIVARVLGWPKNRVTVECLRMGGAFGGKEVQANCWAAVAALGAYKTGRPISVRLPRKLDMILTGKRHPFLAKFEAGFSGEGKIEAAKMSLYADAGWSLDLSEPILCAPCFTPTIVISSPPSA